jgi:chemotaxis protein MotB
MSHFFICYLDPRFRGDESVWGVFTFSLIYSNAPYIVCPTQGNCPDHVWWLFELAKSFKEAMMYRSFVSLIVIMLFSFSVSGCLVTQSTYMKKVAEADSQAQELASLQKKHKDLTDENNALKDKIKTLTADRDQLKEAFANTTKEKEDLDKILKSKSDNLSKTITDMRQKNADLEAENTKLKENLAELKKKEAKVESESNTYKQLMQEMKGEVAKGQVTISELKGKLTLDVVDKILFASGQSEVMKEGLAVLKRVIDILKNVKDKAIRVEGHTDNVKIKGSLANVYRTNWELSAARAINVTKYLQQQGIDPVLLSATAFGEYKPIANNTTSEGRAKNRRIAIILLPKE